MREHQALPFRAALLAGGMFCTGLGSALVLTCSSSSTGPLHTAVPLASTGGASAGGPSGDTPAQSALHDARAELVAATSYAACEARGAEVWCLGSFGGRRHDRPRSVALPRPVVELRAGMDRVCARLDDGSVSCWTSLEPPNPEPIVGLQGAVDLAVSGNTVCVLQSDQGVLCRHLGIEQPVFILLVGVTAIAGGLQTFCALHHDRVSCWGDLIPGGRAASDAFTPVRIEGFPAVSKLALGGWHLCALGTEGRVWCVGANDAGQLGDGGTEDASTPRPVPGLTGVLDIDAAYTRTCAVTARAVQCWGIEDPPSHIGGGADPSTPTAIPATAKQSWVRIGAHVGCSGTPDEALRCWGEFDSNVPRTVGAEPFRLAPPPIDAARIGETAPAPSLAQPSPPTASCDPERDCCESDSDCVPLEAPHPCGCTPCGKVLRWTLNQRGFAQHQDRWSRHRCAPRACPACVGEYIGQAACIEKRCVVKE